MKEYILQNGCSSCVFITVLNALTDKGYTYEFKYKSKDYMELVEYGDGGKDKAILYLNKMLDVLDRKVTFEYPPVLEKRLIKKWIIENINKGYSIDMTGNCLLGFHSYLTTEYDKSTDSFKCINSQIKDLTSKVEWLTWKEIVKALPYPKSHELSFHNQIRKIIISKKKRKPVVTIDIVKKENSLRRNRNGKNK